MLNAIKKFLSSSSPSKKSPSYLESQSQSGTQHDIAFNTDFSPSTTRRKMMSGKVKSARKFDLSNEKLKNTGFNPEEQELEVISDESSEIQFSSKKRNLFSIDNDSSKGDEDPFMDKENNRSGQNFMRIPGELAKRRKTNSGSSDRLKYALSVSKSRPVRLSETTKKKSFTRDEDETRVIEESSTNDDAWAVQSYETSEDKHEDIDEETEEEEEEEEKEEEEAKEEETRNEKRTNTFARSEGGISASVQAEIDSIRHSFKNLDKKYKLIDKIGEGTFSTVYKARVLTPEIQNINLWNSPPIKDRNNDKRLKPQRKQSNKKIKYVALKRIYVTSSPARIYNELNLLYTLTGCSKVAPLIDAIRHQDQVIAVLPYYRHSDFRYFYRDLSLDGIKIYMFELFSALSFVHSHHIIHRDVKPTNFLYDPFKRRGVLVDFGLAEKELMLDATNTTNCLCYRNHHEDAAHESYELQNLASDSHLKGYPKNDPRPGRRANRAGTRGFRAPEVLFKCANQTSKIDLWSAGVVLLTLLSRRFTFFNSPDDIDALVELTTLFGYEAMKKCANLHGLGIDSSIHKLRANSGYPLSQIIQWAVQLDASHDTFAPDSPALETLEAIDANGRINTSKEIGLQFKEGIILLERCFEMNPYKRISAEDALNMPFFKQLNSDFDEDVTLV